MSQYDQHPVFSGRPVVVNPHPVVDRQPQQPSAAMPRRGVDGVLIAAIIGFLVLGVIAVLVGAYMLFALGATAVVIATIMALIPLPSSCSP